MNTQLNVSKLFSISLIVSAILGCGSETDSTQLAKEVELEKLRQEGTIIESLSIENYQVRLKEVDTHQLKVTGIDSNGESRDVTNEITWQTSDESIAKINSNGLLTALKNSPSSQGLITISATTINDISDDINNNPIEEKDSMEEFNKLLKEREMEEQERTNNIQQAKDRANPSIGNKGMEAAETAMEMVERLHSLIK